MIYESVLFLSLSFLLWLFISTFLSMGPAVRQQQGTPGHLSLALHHYEFQKKNCWWPGGECAILDASSISALCDSFWSLPKAQSAVRSMKGCILSALPRSPIRPEWLPELSCRLNPKCEDRGLIELHAGNFSLICVVCAVWPARGEWPIIWFADWLSKCVLGEGGG